MTSPTSSVSGLASGLDTASIISQLMALESQPQTNLKTELTKEQGTVKSLQDLNTKIAALTTQAKSLADPKSWNALSATSSSTAVSVATTTGVAGGTFAFHVDQTAAAHRLTFTASAAGSDVVVGSGTSVTLTMNGTAKTIETGNGTLDGLVASLNGAGTGVVASKVKLDDGSYRLLVTASSTGAAGAFTLTDSAGGSILGGATVTTAGRDAAITLGGDTLHSATNTFTGVLPGVDVTVSAAAVGTDVQVDVSKNASSMSDAVKSLVDNVNAAISQLDTLTAYDPTTKTSGPLAGDAAVQSLRTALLQTIYPSDGSSMASMGIQSDRFGKLVFDPVAFSSAYAADPAKVSGAFTTGTAAGFASRVATVASGASDPYTGTITSSVNGWNSSIKRVTDDIADWDTRLALRQSSLQQQFTALETAMSQMNSQSSWLSSQIASLPSSSK